MNETHMNEMTYRYFNYLQSDLRIMNLNNCNLDIINSTISDHLCECDALIRCILIYNYDTKPIDSRKKTISFRLMKRINETFREAVNVYCSLYKNKYDDWPGARDNFLRTIQMLDIRLGSFSQTR